MRIFIGFVETDMPLCPPTAQVENISDDKSRRQAQRAGCPVKSDEENSRQVGENFESTEIVEACKRIGWQVLQVGDASLSVWTQMLHPTRGITESRKII